MDSRNSFTKIMGLISDICAINGVSHELRASSTEIEISLGENGRVFADIRIAMAKLDEARVMAQLVSAKIKSAISKHRGL